MAVYTQLSPDFLDEMCRRFELGELRHAQGIAAGTINTIYDLSTQEGRFVLRLLEDRSLQDAHFEQALLVHLRDHGLPVPRTAATSQGERLIAHGPRKFVSIFEYVEGEELTPETVTPGAARQVGAFLGQMHLCTASFTLHRPNPFGTAHLGRLLRESAEALQGNPARFTPRHAKDLETLRHILAGPDEPLSLPLPQAVIHGDLFTDNARFVDGTLEAVLDFEMASTGPCAYDLGVALCEWCYQGQAFHQERAQSLLEGYQSVRALTPSERQALPALCRWVAARFALSRFYDFEVSVREGAEREVKDYRAYMQRLSALRAFEATLEGLTALR